MITDDGKHISFEIKYTEIEFGTATSKTPGVYHEKWNSIYKRLVDKCSYLDCGEHEFYAHYQINRNICYAAEGDIVVFLTPKANDLKGIVEGRKYIDSLNQENANIMNLYWEDLTDITMAVISDNKEMFAYYRSFKDKYIDIFFAEDNV